MKLFLISGRAGTGKGETAKAILKASPLTLREESFAFGVKETAKFMGWNGIKDDAGRKLLQGIGKVGRQYDPALWVSQTHNRMQELYKSFLPDGYIISDHRFKNESLFLQQTQKYDIIKIRVESTDREMLKGKETYNDESEISLPSGSEFPEFYDYVIYNDGSLEDLENTITTLLAEII